MMPEIKVQDRIPSDGRREVEVLIKLFDVEEKREKFKGQQRQIISVGIQLKH